MPENIAFFMIDYARDIVPVILVRIGLYLVIQYKTMSTRLVPNWTNLNDWWQCQQRCSNSWSRVAGKNLSMPRFLLASAECALGCSLALTIIVKPGAVAVLGGPPMALAPCLSLDVKCSKAQDARGKVQSHAVDSLTPGVRAGMGLGEALTKIAISTPPSLQAPFAHLASNYHAWDNLGGSLAMLKNKLADPITDRTIEALRLATQVGGNDLVVLFEGLGSMVRAEECIRVETLARQSWTITETRLAAVVPWPILAMPLAKDQTLEVYAIPTGSVILTSGVAVLVVTYLLMLRFGCFDRAPRMMGN